MTLSLPIVILRCLQMAGLGVQLTQHGKPCTGNHNVLPAIFGFTLMWSLLWWAGIFS